MISLESQPPQGLVVRLQILPYIVEAGASHLEKRVDRQS